MTHILSAALAGLALAAALAGSPTTDTAPSLGVAVAAQHAAVQSGLDQAGAR